MSSAHAAFPPPQKFLSADVHQGHRSRHSSQAGASSRISSADRDSALFASACLPCRAAPLLHSAVSYCPSFLPVARRAAIVFVIDVGKTHGHSLSGQGSYNTSPQPLLLTAPETVDPSPTRLGLIATLRTVLRCRSHLHSYAALKRRKEGADAGETSVLRRRDHGCAGRQGRLQHCANATRCLLAVAETKR